MEILVIALIVFVLLTAEAVLFRNAAAKNVSYNIKLERTVVNEEDTVEIIEEIENLGWFPLPWLKTEICTSRWLEFSGTSYEKTSGIRFVPSVFSLRPHQKCKRVWKAKCNKRGVFPLTNTSIIMSDLFGLVNISLDAKCAETLTVLPTPLDIQRMEFSDRELFGDKTVRRFICEDMFSINGVREYTGLEPLSSIHWKSTARQNKLMVFRRDYTTSNRVLIVFNGQKNEVGTVPARLPDFEALVKAATAVLTELQDNDGAVFFTVNDDTDEFSQIFTGRQDIHGTLAALELTSCCDLPRFLEDVGSNGYTDVVLLTSVYGERAADAVYILRRKGVLVNVMAIRNETNEDSVIHISIPEKFC